MERALEMLAQTQQQMIELMAQQQQSQGSWVELACYKDGEDIEGFLKTLERVMHLKTYQGRVCKTSDIQTLRGRARDACAGLTYEETIQCYHGRKLTAVERIEAHLRNEARRVCSTSDGWLQRKKKSLWKAKWPWQGMPDTMKQRIIRTRPQNLYKVAELIQVFRASEKSQESQRPTFSMQSGTNHAGTTFSSEQLRIKTQQRVHQSLGRAEKSEYNPRIHKKPITCFKCGSQATLLNIVPKEL